MREPGACRAPGQVDLGRLARLGFPRAVAEEAARAVQEGYLDVEVPTDLVERTMERCRAALDGVEAGTSSDAGMGATG